MNCCSQWSEAVLKSVPTDPKNISFHHWYSYPNVRHIILQIAGNSDQYWYSSSSDAPKSPCLVLYNNQQVLGILDADNLFDKDLSPILQA